MKLKSFDFRFIRDKFFSAIDLLEFQSRQQLERTKATLLFIGYFGLFAHLFWYFYWHYLFFLHSLVYESLTLRIVGTLFSLLLILVVKKKIFFRYYGLFYTFLLTYNLPFIETYFWLAKSNNDPSLLAYELTLPATMLIFSVLTSLRIFLIFGLLSILFAIAFYRLLGTSFVRPPHLFEMIDVGIYVLFFCFVFSLDNQKNYLHLLRELRKKADSVFHEVNNLFCGIVMKTNVIKKNLISLSEQQNNIKNDVFNDLNKIKNQSLSAAKLLNFLLSGNLDKKTKEFRAQSEVNLISSIVDKSIHFCSSSASEAIKSIQVDYEKDFEVNVPTMLVTHVLINLFRNAFREIERYQRGCISITFSEDEKFNILIFQDTVGSLEKKHIPLIFQRGFSTYAEGFGFGLAFCAEIMHKIEGRIKCTVDSNGTSFHLYFPRN